MASAERSSRVGKVVAYRPLCEMWDQQGREFLEALLDADSFEDLPGVNVKALSTFMGHADIGITLDQYGHLLPGAEDEAAGLLDAFLARSAGAETDTSAPPTAPQARKPAPSL
jgi:hypothetical protein